MKKPSLLVAVLILAGLLFFGYQQFIAPQVTVPVQNGNQQQDDLGDMKDRQSPSESDNSDIDKDQAFDIVGTGDVATGNVVSGDVAPFDPEQFDDPEINELLELLEELVAE